VLLINPASEQFGGVFSRYVPVGIPVPIGTLAAWMMKHGHDVRVADDELGKIEEEQIRALVEGLPRPYVFGLSILAAQSQRAYELQKMLKKMYPDCITIAGGIHVTAVPDEALHAGFNFVIRGEGERPLLKLYEAIRSGKDCSDTESLSFVRPDGSHCHNPDGALIQDLDEIPIFPYHLFNHPKYDHGFITSSRGCPYKCSYCSQRLMTGLTYRYKSPQRMVEEIKILVEQYGQNHITFYDDNFCFKRRRVIELADAICASGLNEKCSFFVQTRADNFYEEVIPHLKRANFTGVGFGMETAVERLALLIQKGETIETHKKAIRLAQQNNINVSLFMIFGLPTETHEDRMASYRFNEEMGIRFTKFNNLIPYPGTKLFNDVKDSGRMTALPGWANFNSTLTATRSIFDVTPLPYIPEGTSEWGLKRDIFRCNMSWYFRPKMLFDVLFGGDKGPGFVKLPPAWWKRPREIFELMRIGLVMVSNYGITLLPYHLGGAIYYGVTFLRRKLHGAYSYYRYPDQVFDGLSRKVVVEKQPPSGGGAMPAASSSSSK
jgi:anaerobic magnesium-protoporphyrin IX monomethyl ester cyclase